MFTHQLHDDENLLQLYRRHEIILAPKVLEIFLLLFIPWYLGLKYDFIFASRMHAEIFLGWTIVVAMFGVYSFLMWAINVYIVTSKRLLHIAHTGLFKKTVYETPLDRILNVSFKTTGLASTVFRYGDVMVQVVGLDQPIILQKVPGPSAIKDFIWKIHLEYGGDQKITYTKPEIAPAEKIIPYAPHVQQNLVKKKRDV